MQNSQNSLNVTSITQLAATNHTDLTSPFHTHHNSNRQVILNFKLLINTADTKLSFRYMHHIESKCWERLRKNTRARGGFVDLVRNKIYSAQDLVKVVP